MSTLDDSLTDLTPSQNPRETETEFFQDPQNPQDPPQGRPRSSLERLFSQKPPRQRLGLGGQEPQLTDLEREEAAVENARLMLVFSQAVKANPDLAGEAQRLGIEIGMDPLVIERNIGKVRELAARRDYDTQRRARLNPMLRAHMLDPNFARIAYDDVDQLNTVEELIYGFTGSLRLLTAPFAAAEKRQLTPNERLALEGITQAPEIGQLQVTRGELFNKGGRGGPTFGQPLPGLTPEEAAKLIRVDRRLLELPQGSAGIISGGARVMGQILTQAPEIVRYALGTASVTALAGAAGGPLGAAGGAGVGLTAGIAGGVFETSRRVETGNIYGDLLKENPDADPATLWSIAFAGGVASGLLEVGGFGLATRPFRNAIKNKLRKRVLAMATVPTTGKAAVEFLKGAGLTLTAELGTELGQENVNVAAELIAGGDPGPYMDRMLAIMEETLKGTLILSTIGPGIQLHTDIGRARDAQVSAQRFDAVMKGVKDSKTATRNPSSFETFMRAALNGQEVTDIFIEATVLRDTLRQGELDGDLSTADIEAIIPELDQLDADGDVRIDPATYLARLGGSRLDEALRPHLRFNDPDAFSLRQAEELSEALPEMVEETSKLVAQEIDGNRAFEASARSVMERVRDEILATGRGISRQEASTDAGLYRAFVEVMTQAINEQRERDADPVTGRAEPAMTPEEFDKKYQLKVVRGEAAQQAPTAEETVVTLGPTEDPKAFIGSEQRVDPLEGAKASDARAVELEAQADAIDRGEVEGDSSAVRVAAFKAKQEAARFRIVAEQGGAESAQPRGDTLRQAAAPATFFSALAVEIEALPTKATTVSGWKQAITGLIKKGKVKKDEVEWTGLLDWLDLQEGKVTKDQVMDFLRANGVRVERVELGDVGKQKDAALTRMQTIETELGELRDSIRLDTLELERGTPTQELSDALNEANDSRELEITALQDEFAELEPQVKVPDAQIARFAEHVVKPRGENYREVLMTLADRPAQPVKFPTFEEWLEQEVTPEERDDTETNRRVYEGDKLRAQQQADARAEVGGFRGGHFDQPNVVAHIRLDDRTDSEGNRVLFVNEIQSDWAQKGRKEGFAIADPGPRRAAIAEEIEVAGITQWQVKDQNGEVLMTVPREFNGEAIDQAGAIVVANNSLARGGISRRPIGLPRAPFVETTKGWLNLALKQILLEAVNGGYDKVAFINGEQAADLFNLSRQVDRISWVPEAVRLAQRGEEPEAGGRRGFLEVFKDGELVNVAIPNPITESEIEDYIGKEPAKRLLESTPDPIHEISGEDLSIGDREMKIFYGPADPTEFAAAMKSKKPPMVPKAMEKLSKKLGGGKVEEVELGGDAAFAGMFETVNRSTGQSFAGPFQSRESAQAEVEEIDDFVRVIGTTTQPAITITAPLRDKVSQGLPLFQQGEQGPAQGEFDPKNLTAFLNESQNSSTFAHELTHYYFEVMAKLAVRPDAPQQVIDDMQTLLEFAGVPDLATWNSMTPEQRRVPHEAIAHIWEKWAFEGKAPSVALEGVFERLRAWMMRVYQGTIARIDARFFQETGQHLPALTDEVRGVFGRMLATEKEITEMEARNSMMPIFQTKEEAQESMPGFTEERWASMQAAAEEAHQLALTKFTMASLRQMKWLSGALGRELKKDQDSVEAVRAGIRKEEEEGVRRQPVHRARVYLKSGHFVTPEGVTEPTPDQGAHRLQTDLLRPLMPEGSTLRDLAGMTSTNNGIAPDEVARMFGYPSGQDLVQDLLDAPTLDEAIDVATEERMVAEFDELLDPAMRDIRIQEALHTEARARFIAIQQKMLEGSNRPVRTMTGAARMAARLALARTPVGQIKARNYAIAEARAAREVQLASRRGDADTARRKNMERLRLNQLASEAAKVQLEIGKVVEAPDRLRGTFKKLQKTDEKLQKTRDVRYVAAARALAAAHGLSRGDATPMDHLEKVREFHPVLFAVFEPMVQEVMATAKPWAELTLEEFRVMRDSVEALWNTSRRENMIEVKGLLEEKDVIVTQVVGAMRPPEAVDRRRPPTEQEKQTFFHARQSWLRRVESYVTEIGGGTAANPGLVHKYLFNTFSEAVDQYVLARISTSKLVSDRIGELTFRHDQEVFSEQMEFTFNNLWDVMGGLRNSGNPSNLRKFLLGMKLVDDQPNVEEGQTGKVPLNPAPWWDFIQELVTKGDITRAHLDYIQFIWDIYEDLLQQTQDTHFKVYGFNFDTVTAEPFELTYPDGETVTYRGGYVPMKYDVTAADLRRDPARESDPLIESSLNFKESVSASRGFTFSRVEYNRTVSLDMRLDATHLDEHLRFIHLQPAAHDVLKLLRDPRIADALTRVGAGTTEDVVRAMFLPWLDSTVHNTVVNSGTFLPEADNFFIFLRSQTSAGIMIANAPVAVQQATGLGVSLQVVELKWLRDGLSRWAKGPTELLQKIVDKSPAMQVRIVEKFGQLRDDINAQLKPGGLLTKAMVGVKKWTDENAFFAQRWFQAPVDVITWDAVYEKNLAENSEGKTDEDAESDAIRAADAAVRLTQGSGRAIDLARVEKGVPLVRLAMMFSNFWFTMFNLIKSERAAANLKEAVVGPRARRLLGITFFAGLSAGVLMQALKGGWEDEDDDGGSWDEFVDWLLGAGIGSAVAARVPVVGPMAMQLLTGEFGGRINVGGAGAGQLEAAGRAGKGLAVEPLKQLLRAIVHGDDIDLDTSVSGTDLKDFAALMQIPTGLPITQPARMIGYLVDVNSGKVEPTGPADFVRGLLTGAAGPGR